MAKRLGAGTFATAVSAVDETTQRAVCLKVVRPGKDGFDQGLDEVKLLRLVNAADEGDRAGIVRLRSCLYYRETLVLVMELLGSTLRAWQQRVRAQQLQPYFTMARIQSIAGQVRRIVVCPRRLAGACAPRQQPAPIVCTPHLAPIAHACTLHLALAARQQPPRRVQLLRSLAFLHSQNVWHCDLKPENIAFSDVSNCRVKVIDLGSACFAGDGPQAYLQTRCYRAPEVVINAPYGPKIDVWSLGCVLAELATGRVLFGVRRLCCAEPEY